MIKKLLMATLLLIQINSCLAGRIMVTNVNCDALSESESAQKLTAFFNFLKEHIFVSEEVKSLIESIDGDIELELGCESIGKMRSKYSYFTVDAVSIPHQNRIVISAHPDEFNAPLMDEQKKQHIIKLIVFELFNLESLKKHSPSHPMDCSSKEEFAKKSMESERHTIAEKGKYLEAVKKGVKQHGWPQTLLDAHESLDRNWGEWDGFESYRQEYLDLYDAQRKDYLETENRVNKIFDSANTKLTDIIEKDISSQQRQEELKKVLSLISSLVGKITADADIRIIAQEIEPRFEAFKERIKALEKK